MLNKVILMGRLTRDPDYKQTPAGTSVAEFSLAVDRDYVKQGEARQTDFLNVVTFSSKADFVNKYFHKGQLVAVCGRLETRSWEDSQSGQKRFAVNIVADEVHFAESKKESAASSQQSTADAPRGFAPADDDKLPF